MEEHSEPKSDQEVVSSSEDTVRSKDKNVSVSPSNILETSQVGSTDSIDSTSAKTPEPPSSTKPNEDPPNEPLPPTADSPISIPIVIDTPETNIDDKLPKEKETVESSDVDMITDKDEENVKEKEASINSQCESDNTIESVDKEHNKSISRELKSLIKSAKESKIINECTQLKTKTRKSRVHDTSNTSLNTTIEANKIQGSRRESSTSLISNSSEVSEKALTRSMRSQNPEFVSKQKQFLNSVTGKISKEHSESLSELDSGDETKTNQNDSLSKTPKKKKSTSFIVYEVSSLFLIYIH